MKVPNGVCPSAGAASSAGTELVSVRTAPTIWGRDRYEQRGGTYPAVNRPRVGNTAEGGNGGRMRKYGGVRGERRGREGTGGGEFLGTVGVTRADPKRDRHREDVPWVSITAAKKNTVAW